MKKIYKYLIPEDGKIIMPVDTEILSVGFQTINNEVLWALVDIEERETEVRIFKVVRTGENFDDEGLTHVGSGYSEEHSYAFHLFESEYVESDEEPESSEDISML